MGAHLAKKTTSTNLTDNIVGLVGFTITSIKQQQKTVMIINKNTRR